METYSIFFELYGSMRMHKDSIINMAKNHHATSIDVTVVNVTDDNDVDYDIEIVFSDEKTLNKFIGDIREYLKNI